MSLNPQEQAPEFCLPDHNQQQHCLKDYTGKWVVVYFYPKDNTSGCTAEACEFTALKPEFTNLDCPVIGISPDSATSHTNFISKHSLDITLLSDPDHEVMQAYGAWGEKKNYGRAYQGVIRSTFIVNPQGLIAHAWYNVKAKGHAQKVQQQLQKLKEA